MTRCILRRRGSDSRSLSHSSIASSSISLQRLSHLGTRGERTGHSAAVLGAVEAVAVIGTAAAVAAAGSELTGQDLVARNSTKERSGEAEAVPQVERSARDVERTALVVDQSCH